MLDTSSPRIPETLGLFQDVVIRLVQQDHKRYSPIEQIGSYVDGIVMLSAELHAWVPTLESSLVKSKNRRGLRHRAYEKSYRRVVQATTKHLLENVKQFL